MQFRLGDIANITSGQTIRGKVHNDPEGTVAVIQMKDLNSSYSKLVNHPYFVKESEVSKKQLLQKGDVLFLAKGNNNNAFVFSEEYPAVIVSMFFVIRPNFKKLNPDYLMWLLNNRETQSFLLTQRSGGSIANIKKSVIEDLMFNLPPIDKQKTIAKIYQLGLKEDDLLGQLREKRKMLMEEILIKLK